MPPKKKVERAATENISLGPQVREGEPYTCLSFLNANKSHSTGELVFGVARIFASFNDTFVRQYPFGHSLLLLYPQHA